MLFSVSKTRPWSILDWFHQIVNDQQNRKNQPVLIQLVYLGDGPASQIVTEIAINTALALQD